MASLRLHRRGQHSTRNLRSREGKAVGGAMYEPTGLFSYPYLIFLRYEL